MPINFKPDLRRGNRLSLAALKAPWIRRLRSYPLAAIWLVICAANALAAEKKIVLPNFPFPAPRIEVKAEAEKLGWNLDFNSGPAHRTSAQLGDEVIGLVSLQDGESLQQWLVQIAVADVTDADRKLPRKPALEFYTSTGHHLVYTSARAALKIRVVGPWKFSEGKSPPNVKDVKDRSHRVVTNDDYLGQGFSEAAAATLVMRQIMTVRGEQQPPVLFGPKPYESATVEQAAPIALAGGLTEDAEHAYLGAQLVLAEFLRIVVGTPGMADVLKSIADVPWLSAIGSGGKIKPTFNLLGLYVQKLPVDPAYPSASQKYLVPFVLKLNDQPAVIANMVVAEPRPPIRNIAGVLGVQATAPDGTGPKVSLYLIGTRRPIDPDEAKVPAP